MSQFDMQGSGLFNQQELEGGPMGGMGGGGMMPLPQKPAVDFGTIPGMDVATAGQGSSQAMTVPAQRQGIMQSLQESMPGVLQGAMNRPQQPQQVIPGSVHPSAGQQQGGNSYGQIGNSQLRRYLESRRMQ